MDAALLDRAQELLRDVTIWRLPPDAWTRPAAAVEALAAAWEAGDGVALGRAVSRLEVLSPNRADPIVDPADVPPPQPLRERLTSLVHIIADPGEGTAGKADGDDEQR